VNTTNYCRQMKLQFSEAMAKPGFPSANCAVLQNAITLADASQKFILPDRGRLYDDKEYKCLDETRPLRLPFPNIALEYSRCGSVASDDYRLTEDHEARCSKVIVFAREVKADDGNDFIVLTAVNWLDAHGLWGPFPEVAIPCVGYLDRTVMCNGRVAIKANLNGVPAGDIADEIGALLCFINVLTCKNVHIEKTQNGKDGRKVKASLPFDSYHILSIESNAGTAPSGSCPMRESRSPREHLRRGHIRRLHDGRRIWVNATVVSAGRGQCAVTKDYAVGAAIPANPKADVAPASGAHVQRVVGQTSEDA